MLLALILISFITVFIAIRHWTLIRAVGELAEAAQGRHTLLLERTGGIISSRNLERLQREFNDLVTETEEGRQRDRDSLRQVEVTLGKIREAILIVDDSNIIRFANTAARSLLGTDRAVTGRSLDGVIRSAAFLDYARRLRSSPEAPRETIEVDSDGAPQFFEVNGSVVSGPDSAEKLTLFVLHDITQMKRLERIRADFVANVSHELRTPVTIIKGFTETLIEDADVLDEEDRNRFLGKIHKNVQRLHELLEDLLILSHMEGQENPLQREPLQLTPLLEEIVEDFRERLSEGQQIVLHPAPDLPDLHIDALRIRQVMENLLDNARRHARGMSQLKVSARIDDGYVCCEVADNGQGIPKWDLPNIFVRFYRVDKGRSRESGGTGLGLSIVKHIILQHGGTVYAESEPGKGTRIGFKLPISNPG